MMKLQEGNDDLGSSLGANRCSHPDENVDSERMLDFWLSELSSLTSGLDSSSHTPVDNVTLRQPKDTAHIVSQRRNAYRFSLMILEDTEEVDIDVLLKEFSILESQYQSTNSLWGSEKADSIAVNRSLSNPNQTRPVARISDISPDNDSAFYDCVSLLSSSGSTTCSNTTNYSGNKELTKTEKIHLAMQKIKEANIKKVFIKVFDDNGGTKTLLIDERMRCSFVMKLLANKHHITFGPRWAIIEHLPELHMERIYEEHELLLDNLMHWTRDSKNRLLFAERPERILMFEDPSLFDNNYQSINHATNNFAQEYFLDGGLPNIEGSLYIKTDSKKRWKKYNSVLRTSGLYYYKNKMSRLSKDLVCLSTFDVNQVYHGIGWKKKFKAPTDYCFAIKHPFLQHPCKSAKYIKYLCVEDSQAFHKWMSAIRIVIHGRQLLLNYESTLVGAMNNDSVTTTEDTKSDISDSGLSSSYCDVAQYPPCSGIINRKMPKLPLTATTTRLLTCFFDTTSTAVAAETAAKTAVNTEATTVTSATTAITVLKVPSVEIRKKLVKTVKFANLPDHILQPCQTLSLVSLTPKLPLDIEDPNDEDILSVVPPPPPELKSPPTTAYLSDLRLTGSEKWQILRELDTAAISTMVAEHYRSKNLYKDTNSSSANNKPVSVTSSLPSPSSSHVSISSIIMGTLVSPKKRLPPPPPPRSERTHLTTTLSCNRIFRDLNTQTHLKL